MKKINLMDVTLRDGSYAINFSFSASDTAIICKELENIGFEYIEIGHGAGLNASGYQYGKAVQTDEEYMQAAESVLKKAKYGMFCIPGVARLEDIDLAYRHNMGFIRIGTNITEVSQSEEYVKRAKKYKMFVAANYLKSYALPPKKFAEQVKLSEKYGVDMVYIVDSAGGMFADDIEKYYQAVKKVTDLPVGFHGHNNLGLALSNSLAAANMGMEFLDCSLQGLGRSSGNASAEILVAALIKRGYDIKINFLKLLDIGQTYIQPLLTAKGIMPLDVVCGYADFHSSYMPHIQKCAAKYSVDPAELIIEISKIDKVNLDFPVLEKVAKRIKKSSNIYLGKYAFNRYAGGEQDAKKS